MDIQEQKLKIWVSSKQKRDTLIEQGLDFLAQDGPKLYQKQPFHKLEVGVKARYLHRGYYCPSPVCDTITENAYRGSILQRATKRSKATHRFYFGSNNQLLIADTILCDGSIQKEYLVYCDDYIYGYTYDSQNNLVTVSEEYYQNGLIKHYFRASCYNREILSWYQSKSQSISSIDYEIYLYRDSVLSETDYYFASCWNNTPGTPEDAQTLFFKIHYKSDGSLAWQ